MNSNKMVALGALCALFGMSLIGCNNTAEGVSKDTEKAGAEVAKTADKVGTEVAKTADKAGTEIAKTGDKMADATKDATKNTAAALTLTPKVKNAILDDPDLRDMKNDINVDSADNVVHLKGHVTSAALKKKAGEIAMKTLKDANATDKLSNELEVK